MAITDLPQMVGGRLMGAGCWLLYCAHGTQQALGRCPAACSLGGRESHATPRCNTVPLPPVPLWRAHLSGPSPLADPGPACPTLRPNASLPLRPALAPPPRATPLQVAAFHSLVGLAAVCTSIASYMSADPAHMDGVHMTTTFLGTLIGAITLTGWAGRG